VTYIFIILLSFLSTSCGAQDWFDNRVVEGEDGVGEAQDEWLYDRSVNVINAYHSLLYHSLTNNKTFKIDGNRCLENTLCMSILNSENTRVILFELLLSKYNSTKKYRTIHSVCEDYRTSEDTILYHIKNLTKHLNDMQTRVENPSMSDILQFGGETESITRYYLTNIAMLTVLRAELGVAAYLFTFIYPSEKYTSYLSTRSNPLRRP
jgi:transcriptional antiterminator